MQSKLGNTTEMSTRLWDNLAGVTPFTLGKLFDAFRLWISSQDENGAVDKI